MDNTKLTYTEVLLMNKDQMDRLESKLDKLDEKVDCLSTRLTVVETESKSNKGWVIWLWGAVITLVNLAAGYMMK